VEILPWPGGPLTFHDLADVLGSGNIIIAFGKTIEATRTNTLGTELPKILSAYALFHGCIAVAMPLWAAARLRRIALQETFEKPKELPASTRLFGRPRIGQSPMLWKEVFAEPGLRSNWLVRIALGVLVLASFIPVGFILHNFWHRWYSLADDPRY